MLRLHTPAFWQPSGDGTTWERCWVIGPDPDGSGWWRLLALNPCRCGCGSTRPAHLLRLHLANETARAHAAWLYTVVVGGDALHQVTGTDEICSAVVTDHDEAMLEILCRMRAGDESVTPAEARAALDWAKEASHE